MELGYLPTWNEAPCVYPPAPVLSMGPLLSIRGTVPWTWFATARSGVEAGRGDGELDGVAALKLPTTTATGELPNENGNGYGGFGAGTNWACASPPSSNKAPTVRKPQSTLSVAIAELLLPYQATGSCASR